jgi:DNA repair protein RadD
MDLWPHQIRAIEQSRAAYRAGQSAWAICAPCGAGKTEIMHRLAIPAAQAGKRVCIYTHRVLLTRQIIDGLSSTGVPFGVIASGFSDMANPEAAIQICSLDTVYARMDKFTFEFPQADIVIVDEAHQQTGEKARAVFDRHKLGGAKRIGFTATPVDIGGMYESIVDAGKYSEMLDCKAHLPMICYGPDRPDLSKIRAMPGGDFSYGDDRKINAVPTIVGRVYEWWRKLNPLEKPAIAFAPGVAESRWFVREFAKRGVPCAHIDGERVMCARWNDQGTEIEITEAETCDSTRKEVIDGLTSGEFKILWNRFVLREAINIPSVYHVILATSMGGLSTYLQSVGRGQRFHRDYDHKILQDHGGNTDRHGLPGEDREWELGCTNNSIQKKEQERRRKEQGEEAEPICCPQCTAMRTHGSFCPACGYHHKRSVKIVRQIDGQLVKKTGRDTKYKAPKTFDQVWRSQLYASSILGHSVSQAFHLAAKKAEKQGVPVETKAYQLPDKGSAEWRKSVREVYPQYTPKARFK